MKKMFIILFLFPLLVSLASSAVPRYRTGQRTVRLRSPDNAFVVTITSTKALEATAESRVEVRSSSGELLVRANYSSTDGEHGYGVTKARWTPDSQFLIYSLESSGGHQAWTSPVWIFSAKLNKIFSLDHALNDAVANPNFVVSAPDRVTVDLFFSKKKRTVSLASLKASH